MRRRPDRVPRPGRAGRHGGQQQRAVADGGAVDRGGEGDGLVGHERERGGAIGGAPAVVHLRRGDRGEGEHHRGHRREEAEHQHPAPVARIALRGGRVRRGRWRRPGGGEHGATLSRDPAPHPAARARPPRPAPTSHPFCSPRTPSTGCEMPQPCEVAEAASLSGYPARPPPPRAAIACSPPLGVRHLGGAGHVGGPGRSAPGAGGPAAALPTGPRPPHPGRINAVSPPPTAVRPGGAGAAAAPSGAVLRRHLGPGPTSTTGAATASCSPSSPPAGRPRFRRRPRPRGARADGRAGLPRPHQPRVAPGGVFRGVWP